MSAPCTREPQKFPISQATPGPNAARFSPLEYVEIVRDFQAAEARKLRLFAESLS